MSYFICSNCGFGSASWIGKCPDCGRWNTLVDRPSFAKASEGKKESVKKMKISSFAKIKPLQKSHMKTGIFEFDRVIGYGLVPGEVILLTGEPGVGKSTLLLQALKSLKTLYISGEEAAEQLKDRADRLKLSLGNFLFSDTIQVEGIVEGVEELKSKPDVLVIDSVQTAYSKDVDSAPGSVSQLKESTMKLINLAKREKIAVILIGHITKEGDVAGPKTLEHLVDCVLSFEGEKLSNFRILRASKNRFGSTDEIGIFEMRGAGLGEVKDPMAFMEEQAENTPGRAIVGVTEGKRPLFFEIQTLASPTFFPVPRRVVKGVDYNKVLLLLAVIKKLLRVPLDRVDIYVNVVGGVSITSTAVDLGIIASILSAVKNLVIPSKSVFTGEVGLLGEVRKVYSEEKIVTEARRLKFKKIYSSKTIKTIAEMARIFS